MRIQIMTRSDGFVFLREITEVGNMAESVDDHALCIGRQSYKYVSGEIGFRKFRSDSAFAY